MNDILLLGKRIIPEKSKVILDYKPDESWEEHFKVMGGEWSLEDGWLVGQERENRGGILLSRKRFEQNVMLTYTAAACPPATRDLNAVFCASWDEEADYLGISYVCGLNGWYDHKSGIERNPDNGLHALTSLYKYTPGDSVRITAGAIDGHAFLVVDGELVTELIDPYPIIGGHVGFSPYSTKFKVTDILIQEIYWEPRHQSYEPEF